MKKNIIIFVVLALLVLSAAGIIYLNNVYLPVKIKGGLIKVAQDSTGLNAEIEKLKFSLIRGLIIENITLYDKTKDKENTVLSIKEIYFNFLLIPLIKTKTLIIPIIHINSPYIYARYKKDNAFNLEKIFSLKPAPAGQKKKFSFLVYKINIFNGKCLFEDERTTPAFSKTVEDFGVGLTISPFAKISFLLKGRLALAKNEFAKLSGRGEYSLTSKEVKANLELANLILPEFNPYLQALPFGVEAGRIDSAEFDFKFKGKIIGLKGISHFKNLALKKEGLTLTGDIDLEPDLTYALEKNEFDYKANAKLIKIGLAGLPRVEKINDISGGLALIKDKLSADNLKLQALDSTFTLKANIDNFASPYLKAALSCEELNLEKAFALVPHPADLKLTGVSRADINFDGNLKKMPPDINARFDITDGKLQAALLKEPVTNIKGRLDLTVSTLNWQNFSFGYNNITYSSTGKLLNFMAPRISFALASKGLNLRSDLKIKDKLITLNVVDGEYLNSKFFVKGSVDAQDAANPLLGLDAKLKVDIADTLAFLPAGLKENIQKAKLEGNLNISGSLNGKAKDFKDWNMSLRTSSDAVSLYGLKFTGLYFNLRQRNQLLGISAFSASGYGGQIKMQFDSDLKTEVPAYALKLSAQRIDLAKLKTDTGFKDKDITGILNIDANLYGDFKDTANLKGTALVSAIDGRLWQLGLLKGLGDLVFIPDYEKIIFKEGAGRFDIGNKFISTENLQLTSEQLKLNCKGKAGFDGSLDLTVYNEVNKELVKESTDIRKFVTAILGQLGNNIVVKVSGTLQKPKYSIVPLPVDMIKSIKDFILGK